MVFHGQFQRCAVGPGQLLRITGSAAAPSRADRMKDILCRQTEQPDGSIIVKVIKQYNAAPVGNYLD